VGICAVIIPAYNEAATLRSVAQRALAFSPCVIIVDDGSTDDSAAVVRELPVVLLRNDANQGKAASLWQGMQHALKLGADAIITLDADGQHAPEDIPRLIEASHAHPRHIIIGARLRDPSSIPASRYIANRIANFWISWACGQRLEDSQSGFRLYPAGLFTRLRIRHDRERGFVFESEVLIRAAALGYRCLAVPIPAVYHANARPSYYRHRDTWRITRMVAWSLLSRGLYLPGVYRAFFARQ
jgi:glycosyltransferase involved in cell wall biosynthesis